MKLIRFALNLRQQLLSPELKYIKQKPGQNP